MIKTLKRPEARRPCKVSVRPDVLVIAAKQRIELGASLVLLGRFSVRHFYYISVIATILAEQCIQLGPGIVALAAGGVLLGIGLGRIPIAEVRHFLLDRRIGAVFVTLTRDVGVEVFAHPATMQVFETCTAVGVSADRARNVA